MKAVSGFITRVNHPHWPERPPLPAPLSAASRIAAMASDHRATLKSPSRRSGLRSRTRRQPVDGRAGTGARICGRGGAQAVRNRPSQREPHRFPGDGLVLGTDGVDLDLNGNSIDETGLGVGVRNGGYDSVTHERDEQPRRSGRLRVRAGRATASSGSARRPRSTPSR
jgi:hypothetical protein